MAFSFGTPSSSAPSFGFGANTSVTTKPATGFGTSSFPFGASTTQAPCNFGTTTTSSGFEVRRKESQGIRSYPGLIMSAGAHYPGEYIISGFGSTPLSFGSSATPAAGLGSTGLGSGLTQGIVINKMHRMLKEDPSGYTRSFHKACLSFITPCTMTHAFVERKVEQVCTQVNGIAPQQQQQQQVPTTSDLEQYFASVIQCCMFGDERDEVLAKWNLLQASWGTGKGFYNQNLPPVEYTSQNPFYRFKAIVYSVKPTVTTRDGFVALQFNKKEEEVRKNHEQVGQGLANIFGLAQRLSLTLHLDTIRPIKENSTLVFIFMEEKSSNGQVKRIPNTELTNFLLQPTQINQLKQIGVTDCYTFNSPDKDQIQEYLDNPPAGIDVTLWKQAQADNPDPERLIPMPLLGFGELRWRYHCQVEETKRHTAFLDTISEEILKVKAENETARLKINEYKQKVIELEHKLLEVMVKSVISRNIGVALRPEEEMLRSQLDTIHAQLNSPQFAGRLQELLTQVRLHKQEVSQRDSESYNMTPAMKDEIKQFLFMQQDAIKSVLDIMQSDEADLKILANDMEQLKAKIHSKN